MAKVGKSQHDSTQFCALFHPAEERQEVPLCWWKGWALAEAFASHRPIEPFAILGMALAVLGILPFGPKRIFEDQGRSEDEKGKPHGPGQGTHNRRKNNEGPANDDHRPLKDPHFG
jgi:hypothetical protein